MVNKRKLKLASKISFMVIVIVIISISISIISIGNWSIQKMNDNLERNILNVVNITRLSPTIISGLENPEADKGKIQLFLNATQDNCEDIDIMVVADKNGVRFGHTLQDRVGHLFSAEDHDKAINKGLTYVSTGPGTLGDSMRAFAPIKDSDGNVLGFVMAGSLLTSIKNAKTEIKTMAILFIILGSFIGTCGALYISNVIKKSLLGFEPHDIARLYSENNAILETVKEGIIAIDENYKITLINDQGLELLDLKKDSLIGEDIRNIYPKAKLVDAIESGEAILDYQHSLGNIIVTSNTIPMFKDGKSIGSVTSFRDQTDLIKLSEEITGVKKIVDSLRATTHEFKNKLHVILGFIELDKKDEAKKYIINTNEDIQNNVSQILNLIKEPNIAALLIGKINRGNELKVNIKLDEKSSFENNKNLDINSLTIIIGNLIDNSLENLNSISKKNKLIYLYIKEDLEFLNIILEDNGTGMKNTSIVFNKGYTTKDTGLGYGLFLVKNNVEKYNGHIHVKSTIDKGTKFEINI